jgi:hypothetical protein
MYLPHELPAGLPTLPGLTASLRAAAIDYLDSFDPDKWHKEPVRIVQNERKPID